MSKWACFEHWTPIYFLQSTLADHLTRSRIVEDVQLLHGLKCERFRRHGIIFLQFVELLGPFVRLLLLLLL